MAGATDDKVDPLEASEANYAKLEGQFQEVGKRYAAAKLTSCGS
jgi:hypothetical protein